MKANSIGELFGTLQQSIVDEWRKHLKTSKYSKHMALDEFYTEMPELIDQLIEDYQAINGIVDDYKNVFDASTMNALEYLEELRKFIKDSRAEFIDGESELESDLDNILSMIDSTIYKVRELKENKIMSLKNKNKIMSLKNYLLESLNINEAIDGDPEDILKKFKKLSKYKPATILKRIGFYNLDVWEKKGWSSDLAARLYEFFINWCMDAYAEVASEYERNERDLAADSWYTNIVANSEQFYVDGLDIFKEDEAEGEDEDMIDEMAEYIRETIVPMAYKAVNGSEIKMY